MENASKALLIAASVLIVILIIVIGVRIFSSAEGIKGTAQSTGETINKGTGDATSLAIGKIAGDLGNPIDKSESYVGYYADLDNDGKVDGIIYHEDKEQVGNYYISKVQYNNQEVDIIKVSGAGKRFYVISLTDIGGSECEWGSAKEKENDKWKLPSSEQWEKLADNKDKVEKVFSTSAKLYWSSTEATEETAFAFTTATYSMKTNPYNKETIKCFVRLVTIF